MPAARIIIVILCLITSTSGCGMLMTADLPPVREVPDVPSVVSTYLQERIVEELNFVRSDPDGYADIIEQRLGSYDGKEGKRAIREAIDLLRQTRPRPALVHSSHVAKAARDHVKDQSSTGRIGHDGSDGSMPGARIDRYVKTLGYGENIQYGLLDPRDIIVELLIDDGVPDRGHRINILDPRFEFVGVATGPHARYRHMCVMDFTRTYTTRGAFKPTVAF